jgi:hypothetical protein
MFRLWVTGKSSSFIINVKKKISILDLQQESFKFLCAKELEFLEPSVQIFLKNIMLPVLSYVYNS